MPDKRELEDTAGGRFWEIWSEGNTVYSRSGKTGSAGQTKLKEVADVADEITKQVAKKLGEGFIEKGGGPKGPDLDAKQLKAHLKNITGAADDGGPLVLADWLQQQNHPWGELIALQHAATTGKKAASIAKQAEKHFTMHKGAILGALAASPRFEAEWDRGFLKKVTVGVSGDSQEVVKSVKALAALPAAHLLEMVAFDPSPVSFATWRDSEASSEKVVKPWTELDKVVAALPERVKHVGFGAWPVNAAAAYVEMPTFTAVSKACAALTTIELTGTAPDKLGKLSLPSTKDLRVHFANANTAAIAALASAKVPKLQWLTVWLGGESYCVLDSVHEPEEYDYDEDDDDDDEGGSGLDRYPATFSAEDMGNLEIYDINVVSAEELATLLAAAWPTTLKHLSLGAAKLGAEHVAAIVAAPLIERLSSLTLSGLDDDAAVAIAKAKKTFAELTTFDLSANKLGAAARGKLAKAFPSATLPAEDVTVDPFLFRYVATME